MSDAEQRNVEEEYYAPNQQAVRGDGSGPAEEGTGGAPPVEGDGGDVPGEPDPKAPEVEVEPEVEPERAAKAGGGAS